MAEYSAGLYTTELSIRHGSASLCAASTDLLPAVSTDAGWQSAVWLSGRARWTWVCATGATAQVECALVCDYRDRLAWRTGCWRHWRCAWTPGWSESHGYADAYYWHHPFRQ